MARFHVVTNALTGVPVEVPFTPEEEQAADNYIPTPEEIVAAEKENERHVVKSDNFVQNFINMTPAQVSAYVNANVTSLATAKPVIEKLCLMVLLLAKREFK